MNETQMPPRLEGRKAVVLAEELYEELELWYPVHRLREEGAVVTIVGTGSSTYRGKNGYPVEVDGIWAGILRGRDVTCYHAIRDDVINAGANYEDREVVVDGNLITSRHPGDLGAFCRAIIQGGVDHGQV